MLSQKLLKAKIGATIYALRTSAGLTQKQLATKVGTTQSAISDVETGITEPMVSTLSRLADACDCELVIVIRAKTNKEWRIY